MARTEKQLAEAVEILSSAKCLLMTIGVREGRGYSLYADIDRAVKSISAFQDAVCETNPERKKSL